MQEEIKKLIKQNIKLTQQNKELIERDHKMIKKIRRYVIISEVTGILKLIIIVVPIILGILYIPPLFRDLLDKYQEFFGIISKSGSINVIENILSGFKDAGADIDTDMITPDLLKLLK